MILSLWWTISGHSPCVKNKNFFMLKIKVSSLFALSNVIKMLTFQRCDAHVWDCTVTWRILGIRWGVEFYSALTQKQRLLRIDSVIVRILLQIRAEKKLLVFFILAWVPSIKSKIFFLDFSQTPHYFSDLRAKESWVRNADSIYTVALLGIADIWQRASPPPPTTKNITTYCT